MKTSSGIVASCVGIFLAFLLQQALPAIGVLHGARLVLVPMIFCYAAMVLPLPAMLGVAFYTGLLTDLMYLHVVAGRVEIALGWSIVFYVIFGLIAQGLQETMRRGHWWPFVLLSGLGTSAVLLLQLVMISFRREGFAFDDACLWRAFSPGFLAAALAPALHFAVKPFGSFFPERDRIPRDY